MIICKIDDTGVEFNSLTELAKFLGISTQRAAWKAKYRQDQPNHFWCREYGITILYYHSQRKRIHRYDPEKARQYYESHKEQIREWRNNNKEKIKESKKRWNAAHKEYYNNYYKEQRRKRKEMLNGK